MGLSKLSRVLHLFITIACLRSQCFAASNVSVKLQKTPLAISRRNNAKFVFEVLEGKDVCRNCTRKCKLDVQNSSNCEAKEVLYRGLQDGDHMFEVCTNGYRGVGCATYNWTIDSVPPTAYVAASSPFTYAPNVAVDISFTEPCTLGGGFGCASVNSCNLLVYGPCQVIPSSLKSKNRISNFLCWYFSCHHCVHFLNSGGAFAASSDGRSVLSNLIIHILEKQVQLNNEMRTVQATNNYKSLQVYLYFSEPVLNSTKEIQRFIHTNQGSLHPIHGESRGNRRFVFLVKYVSDVAVVTISVESSSIISRQGTPVSPISPVTYLYDSRRPSVKLSTTSNMRTKEDSVPVLIQFSNPVFNFNSSPLSISGGHFQSFRAISQSVYSVDIHADENLVSIRVLENTTRDVAGNRILASNILRVRHYVVPLVSYVVSAFATAIFVLTSLAAGLLTVSTASLQSIKGSSRSSSLADPARILFRTACQIQVFALSRWLAVTLPVEYYEFTRGLQWSIPHLSLPWKGGYVRSVMVDSSLHAMPHSEFSKPRLFANPRSGETKLEKTPSIAGLPLTPMEYTSFFVSQNLKPEAGSIMDLTDSNGWREFEQNLLVSSIWWQSVATPLSSTHSFEVEEEF